MPSGLEKNLLKCPGCGYGIGTAKIKRFSPEFFNKQLTLMSWLRPLASSLSSINFSVFYCNLFRSCHVFECNVSAQCVYNTNRQMRTRKQNSRLFIVSNKGHCKELERRRHTSTKLVFVCVVSSLKTAAFCLFCLFTTPLSSSLRLFRSNKPLKFNSETVCTQYEQCVSNFHQWPIAHSSAFNCNLNSKFCFLQLAAHILVWLLVTWRSNIGFIHGDFPQLMSKYTSVSVSEQILCSPPYLEITLNHETDTWLLSDSLSVDFPQFDNLSPLPPSSTSRYIDDIMDEWKPPCVALSPLNWFLSLQNKETVRNVSQEESCWLIGPFVATHAASDQSDEAY